VISYICAQPNVRIDAVGKLLLATNNQGKIREFSEILADLGAVLLSPADLGLTLDVAETGTTYAENASLKAAAFARASGLVSMADDSGLEVEALLNAPGVYSARYGGPGLSDADRRHKLMQEVSHAPAPRRARFVCFLAIAPPNGEMKIFEGMCEGEIILEERGLNGFGYDPIFYLPDYQCTMAELPSRVKNQISHRGRAVQAASDFIKSLLKSEA
jgi:XTP/dITP diphosphohydrolase